MGSLGTCKPKAPEGIQQKLLEWLVLVYDVVEDPSILSKLYPVLFNLIDIVNVRFVLRFYSSSA